MERRDFIVGTLVKTGFRTSLKGFWQFCECVELYTDDHTATVDSIYEHVAKDFGCSKGSVEKNLRRLFECSDARAAFGRLFGIDEVDTGNKEMISVFAKYVFIKRDLYSSPQNTYKLEKSSKSP